MTVRAAAAVLGVACLVAACAGTAPRMSSAERLELYRASAGEPVRSFSHPSSLWGWRAVNDRALIVWPTGNRAYLLELFGTCPNLAFAQSIGLTNRTGRVSAGFDSVVVTDRGGARGRTQCRIDTIRPIETRVREPRDELGAIEYVDRDPSVPAEPE
jgi:hypothetical protein